MTRNARAVLPWVFVAAFMAACTANLVGIGGTYRSPKPRLGSSDCYQAQREFIAAYSHELQPDRNEQQALAEFHRLCD